VWQVCGIVGLHLKNAELRPRLGELLVPMLDCMSSRGPDSAGVALYDGEAMEVVKDVGSPTGVASRASATPGWPPNRR
jgi:methylamine---glutamate N-methyltransferase subunit A